MKNITMKVLTVCFALCAASVSTFAGAKVTTKATKVTSSTSKSYFDYACGRTNLYDQGGFKIGEVTIYCNDSGVSRMVVKMCM